MTNREQWKVVSEFPAYEVSNLGRVRRTDTGKIKQLSRRGGNRGRPTADYICAKFFRDGKPFVRDVHRLVAIAFCPLPSWIGAMEVNHKDTVKSNIKASNLEWLTSAEHKALHATQRKEAWNEYRGRLAA